MLFRSATDLEIIFVSLFLWVSVMSNFMCQLAWAPGYPDIWSYIIMGVSVRLFLGEINI